MKIKLEWKVYEVECIFPTKNPYDHLVSALGIIFYRNSFTNVIKITTEYFNLNGTCANTYTFAYINYHDATSDVKPCCSILLEKLPQHE